MKENKHFQAAIWVLGGKNGLFQRNGMNPGQGEQTTWGTKLNLKELSIKIHMCLSTDVEKDDGCFSLLTSTFLVQISV